MKKHTLFQQCSVLAACLFAILIVAGCTGDDKNKIDESYDKWKVKAENSKGYSPSMKRRVRHLGGGESAAPVAGEPEAAPEEKTEKPLPDSPVSLNMSDVNVAVLLRYLARAAGQNIMINEKVGGRANINIQRAPWDQVFLGVLKTHGLSYRWEGNIIRIMTAADVEQEMQKAAQKKDMRELEPLSTRIIRIDYTRAEDLKKTLEAFITKRNDGKSLGSIMVDTHTNSLIVQALNSDITNMLPLIKELDQPTPQILIEAHIVEATSSTARQLGIEWGGKYQTTINDGSTVTIGETSAGGANPAFDFPIAAAGGMALGFLLEGGGNQLNAQLYALQTENKIKILSSPSITTTDNTPAIFKSGQEVPYTAIDTGTANTSFKEAVLELNVTPHVIDGEAIKMDIKVKKNSVGAAIISGGEPPIIKKEAETNVILFDGQTTVIGGLNTSEDERLDRGVPGLQDIPLLGVFFRGEGKSREAEDLLIFITPHILKQRLGNSDTKTGE